MARKRKGQTPSIMKNIAGRRLKDTLTRLLPNRIYLTKKEFLIDAENNFNNFCAYCNSNRPLTREHVVSNMEGGTLEFANVIPVCQPCNDEKREKPWREFANSKGSQFILTIEERIKNYTPLDIEKLRNHPDPKIQKAFQRYDERMKHIEAISQQNISISMLKNHC